MENKEKNPYAAPAAIVSQPVPMQAVLERGFRSTKLFAWLAASCIAFNIPLSAVTLLEAHGKIDPEAPWLALLYLAFAISALSAVVFFCIWKYRSACNARYFYGASPNYSPGMCAGCYFIPILNWFRPFQCMREIFDKTYEVIDAKSPTAMIFVWWLSFIAMNVASRVELVGISVEMTVVIAIMDFVSVFSAIIVIYCLTRRQYEIMDSDDLRAKIGDHAPIRKYFAADGVPMKRPQI